MRLAILATALLLAPQAMAASVKFAPYEGADAIQTGQGGSKISKNGIDYWNTGTPPRRYQIIGVITDKRWGEEWGDGDPIGSRKVAKIVLQNGGNAVILVSAQDRNSGMHGVPTGGGAFMGVPTSRATTLLHVVKYLDR